MKLFPLKISVQKRHFCNVACVQEDMRKKIKKMKRLILIFWNFYLLKRKFDTFLTFQSLLEKKTALF